MPQTLLYDTNNTMQAVNTVEDTVFGSKTFNKDVLMRTFLFGLLFYIVNSDLVKHLMRCISIIPVEIIQTIIFSILYLLISVMLSMK